MILVTRWQRFISFVKEGLVVESLFSFVWFVFFLTVVCDHCWLNLSKTRHSLKRIIYFLVIIICIVKLNKFKFMSQNEGFYYRRTLGVFLYCYSSDKFGAKEGNLHGWARIFFRITSFDASLENCVLFSKKWRKKVKMVKNRG